MSIPTHGYGILTPGTTVLTPIEFSRESPKQNELLLEVLYCGVCHSDVHAIGNSWGHTSYPLVPGHEAVSIHLFLIFRINRSRSRTSDFYIQVCHVQSVGPSARTFSPGDIVGVSNMVNSCLACSACTSGWESHCESATGPTLTSGGYLVPQGDKFTTLGAWSDRLVVREEFVVKIPAGLDISKVAPLMCPGTATYGPLKRFEIKKGESLGIVGIGGPGHLAVMMAKAMGARVIAFTTSEGKRAAAEAMGADLVVLSTNKDAMKSLYRSLDYVLSTIPNAFDPSPYLATLKRRGTMTVMGLLGPYKGVFNNLSLAAWGLKLTGSMIGSVEETRETLQFFADNGLTPIVEMIKLEEINEAVERLKEGGCTISICD